MKYGIKKSNGIFVLFLCSFLFVLSCESPVSNKENPQANTVYTITFDADNGSAPSIQKVEAGSKVSRPSNPVKQGYSFDYWFNTATDIEWNFNTVVTSDVTLKAKWIPNLNLSGTPTINGVNKIHGTLTVDTSSITGGTGGGFTYQWKADGVNIQGATDESYTITGADVGVVITCVIFDAVTGGSITASWPDNEPVPYTLRLDTSGLDAIDTVSFSATGTITETTAGSDTVDIHYTLTGGHATDELLFSFQNTNAVIITATGTNSIAYSVNPDDALNGIITITAASVHTNFIVLDVPTSVSFTQNGTITFTPGENNSAAGSTYTFTLYKDGTEVSGFTDNTITSGTTVTGLEARMLSEDGAYTVKIKANTSNPAYTSASFESASSNAVYVYSVTVTITGANGADKITINRTDYKNNFTVYAFSGENITLTATPDTGRKVTWNNEVVSNIYVFANISANHVFTAAFAVLPVITITKQPTATTTVTEGSIRGNLSVAASVTEGATLSYQWYSNTTNSNSGGTSINNGTNASLNIPTTLTMAGGTYYYFCEVSATGGAIPVRSDTATIKIIAFSLTNNTKTYNGNSQGVTVNYSGAGINETTAGTITVYYTGTGGTSYAESTTPPRRVGTYNVSVTTSGGTNFAAITVKTQIGTLTINKGDPFKVGTIEDLQHVGKPTNNGGKYDDWVLDMDYEQIANINMTEQAYTAIGNNSTPFKGNYNGNGYTITGLTINSSSNYQGMFGYINTTGTVSNVALVDVSIKGVSYVGGIAGSNSGTVQNCYSTGSVNGTTYVGGVVGYNSSNSTIQNCYSTGSVSGNSYVGGIVGSNYGTVQNCISLNDSVTANDSTSNIGRVTGSTGGTRTNNYAWTYMTVTTPSSTWTPDRGTSRRDGADLSLSIAKTKAAWVTSGFLFVDSSPSAGPWIWHGNTNNGDFMPSLGNEQIPWPNYLQDPAGTGTVDDPFKVGTVEDLQHVGKPTINGGKYVNWNLDKHYEQIANINMTEQAHTPIGNDTTRFTGSYNGNGYTITGLTINSSSNRQGMFGYINTTGTVSNVALVDVRISGNYNYTGGIVGDNSGTVQNCYSTGSVSGNSYVGGIVGGNYGTVQNCSFTGNVNGSIYSLGGIAGNNSGTVQNCSFTGNVNGSSSGSGSIRGVGGIAGSNSGTVQNCYSTGSVSGTNSVGGIVGENNVSYGTVKNCVALNDSVTVTDSTPRIGRVTQTSIGSTLINNYAWTYMTVTTPSSTWTPDRGTSRRDGADVRAGTETDQYNNQSFWQSTMGWSFGTNETSPWQWNSTENLPKLWFE